MIAWVAQDTHLFNTTMRANIALARPGASQAEVTAAARAAQLGDWIDSLPDGLDTTIGEQGAQLSGGQRQRLALARALLARTPILILDEPTSGLDEATAERLLSDVVSTTAGKSLLYVTHRLDQLAVFDEIYVIEDGQVAAGRHRRGRHDLALGPGHHKGSAGLRLARDSSPGKKISIS